MPKMRPVSFLWNDHLAEYVSAAAWSPDDKFLAFGSASGELGIFQSEDGISHWYEKLAHSEGLDNLAWHPNGRLLASCGQDGKARIWDVSTKQKVCEMEAGAAWVEHISWGQFKHPQTNGADVPILAVGGGTRVTLWTDTGKKKAQLMVPKTLTDMTWTPNGSVLAVATSNQVVLYSDIADEQLVVQRTWPIIHPVLNMAFSPNGRWMMTGTQDNAVHVFNCETSQDFHMSGYPGKVRQMAWHRGSRWFATNGVKETVLIWDCAGQGPEGRRPAMLESHFNVVSALQFQTNGDLLASGDRDGSLTFWNPNQYNPKVSAAKIGSGVTKLAWSRSKDLVAVGGEEGDLQVLGL